MLHSLIFVFVCIAWHVRNDNIVWSLIDLLQKESILFIVDSPVGHLSILVLRPLMFCFRLQESLLCCLKSQGCRTLPYYAITWHSWSSWFDILSSFAPIPWSWLFRQGHNFFNSPSSSISLLESRVDDVRFRYDWGEACMDTGQSRLFFLSLFMAFHDACYNEREVHL